MTNDQPVIYRVLKMKNARYIRLRDDAAQEYYRIDHIDGAYSLLPVPRAPEIKIKMQPISCQQGTPGGMPK
jgi:hypothetical protein